MPRAVPKWPAARAPGLAARSLVALLLSLSFLPALAGAETSIDGVRAYRAPEYTRFVFDVSVPPTYQVLPDSVPGRVVIDFRAATLKAPIDSVDLQGSPVQRVRSGQQADGTLRIVLDLAVAVRVNSFTLQPNDQYGHRLVVDLYDLAVEQKAKTVEDFAPPTPGGAPRKIVVAIDAGHGGEDPGARGMRGTREKDVVLAIARAVHEQLRDDPAMRGVLIRDGDYYIGLKERRTIARRKHDADIFVSIHADAFTRRSARGASVFAVSRRGATSNTAAYLAEAENRADQLGGIDPKSADDVVSVISDLIMEGTMSHSLHVARSVLDELGGFAMLHKRTVEQAGFMVLKEPNMPSILVETGFISNPEEEQLLRSGAHQQRLARAVVSGVRNYFSRYPPPGTVFAARREGRPAVASTLPAAGESSPASAAPPKVPDSPLSPGADPDVARALNDLAGTSAKPAAPAKKPSYILHKVRSGQSLGWLSQKYGVSQSEIKDANGLRRNDLYIGETLKIPRS